jgi:uncharacterized protein
MPGKFCVNLTRSLDDPDRATVGFVVANAALGSDQETLVFLSTEGVRLAQQGVAETIHETGFAPLAELMSGFIEAGGLVYVCSPCFKKRGLTEDQLIPGVTLVGGAKLVEFLADGSPCVSF